MRGHFTIAGFSFVLGIAAVAGCYSGTALDPSETSGSDVSSTDPAGSSGGTGSGGEAGGGAAGGGAATGLPCDVDTVLAQKCRTCHGSPLTAPMALLTYEDLVAPSPSDPSKTNAVAAIARMRSTSTPMPPGGGATDPDIQALETWVAAGTPKGTCGAPANGDGGAGGGSSGGPAPVMTCTSGTTWSGEKGPEMNPGRACITCHQQEKGSSIVRFGGTVYPTLREPDMCEGVNGGATVRITDAAGRVFNLPVGPSGNFSLTTAAAGTITMPFKAKVIKADGTERAMATPQSTGDCNSCHGEVPKNGAPGRILLP